MYCVAFVEFLGSRNMVRQHSAQHGSQPGYCSADCRLGDAERLCQFILDAVSPHVRQCHDDRLEQSQNRWPETFPVVRRHLLDQCAQVGYLIPGEASGMIHADGPFL